MPSPWYGRSGCRILDEQFRVLISIHRTHILWASPARHWEEMSWVKEMDEPLGDTEALWESKYRNLNKVTEGQSAL